MAKKKATKKESVLLIDFQIGCFLRKVKKQG